jgi:hypothetical protein
MPKTDGDGDISDRPRSEIDRHTELVADVSARLRSASLHLTNTEFSQLVQDIVDMALRYESPDLDGRPSD